MRNLKNIRILLGLAVVASAGIAANSACAESKAVDRVEQSGDRRYVGKTVSQDDLRSEVRNLSGFTGVDIGGAMTATISVGSDYRVVIEAKPDVLPRIITEVRNGSLIVKYEKGWWKSMRGKDKGGKVRVTVSLPALDDLDISGASAATVTGVNSDRLKVDISGASVVSIEGSARAIDVDISGASVLKAGHLYSEVAEMDLSGASSAKVNVANELRADASGASSVCYEGNPRVNKETSGSSSITGGCGRP